MCAFRSEEKVINHEQQLTAAERAAKQYMEPPEPPKPIAACVILWRSLDRKGMGVVRAYRNKTRADDDLALLRQTLDAERSYEMEEFKLYE